MDMVTKHTKEELEKMSRSEISHYVSEITQTKICADKKYCDLVLSIWQNKPKDVIK